MYCETRPRCVGHRADIAQQIVGVGVVGSALAGVSVLTLIDNRGDFTATIVGVACLVLIRVGDEFELTKIVYTCN